MEFFKDLFAYLKQHKKFWLVPLILIFLFFGLLLILSGNTALAPLIYTIF